MLKSIIRLMVVFIILIPVQALGETYLVSKTNPRDFKTIQRALRHVQPGDILDLGPGLWQESVLVLDMDLVIRAESGPGNTILDGEGAHRGLHVTAGAEVVLSGVTIQNCLGYDGAGIHVDSGSELRVDNCILSYNISTYTGGAAFVREPGSRLEFENCRFENNFAPLNAGAVGISESSHAGFFRCWFENNSSNDMAGAIANFAGSMMEVRECVFTRNTGGEEGAIRIYGSPAIIANNTFHGNTSGFGTVYCWSSSSITIQNNIFAAESRAFGVYLVDYGSLEMGCNIFWGNRNGDIVNYVQGSSFYSIDPEFCDAGDTDFSLCSGSPALPGEFNCGLIGAFGEGCEPCGLVPVQKINWGTVKSMFR